MKCSKCNIEHATLNSNGLCRFCEQTISSPKCCECTPEKAALKGNASCPFLRSRPAGNTDFKEAAAR